MIILKNIWNSNLIMATFIGINKYNHIYPNYLSQSEIDKVEILI